MDARPTSNKPSNAITARSKSSRYRAFLQADQERAIGLVTEALRANPGQCQGLAGGSSFNARFAWWARVVPLLLDIARTNADMRLRLTAIKRLGEQRNEQVTEELIKIYDADRTKGDSHPGAACPR